MDIRCNKECGGKVENFVTTKSLILAARNAHSLYKEATLKEKKEKEEEQRCKNNQRIKYEALTLLHTR